MPSEKNNRRHDCQIVGGIFGWTKSSCQRILKRTYPTTPKVFQLAQPKRKLFLPNGTWKTCDAESNTLKAVFSCSLIICIPLGSGPSMIGYWRRSVSQDTTCSRTLFLC